LWSLALGAGGESRYDLLIGMTARQYGLEPALVKAVIKCESGFDPLAVSRRGAQGLMQLMPATQYFLGVTDAFAPQDNIRAGVRYLAMLRQLFGGTVPRMLAAYNAGPQAIIDAESTVPPFPETQRYVQCVLAAWQRYRQQGMHDRVPSTAEKPPPAADEEALLVYPVRFASQGGQAGQRLTLHLEAMHTRPQAVHGVVMLTYPEPLVASIELLTAEHETMVRLPEASIGQPGRASPMTTVYQVLRGYWPAWHAGQRRSAVLTLVPRLQQDITMHLNVFLYDATGISVQPGWSTVVRLPMRPGTGR
jgi:hypothetical protein